MIRPVADDHSSRDQAGYPARALSDVPFSSSGRRFLATLGFSLFQAVVFGGLIALLMYFRAPRALELDTDTSPPIHRRLRAILERLEAPTYDWRARALGRESQRPDEVVIIALDDDTLAAARQDEDPQLGVYPWPRSLLGAMTDRLIAEGAKLVMFHPVFGDLSPRECTGDCPGDDARADDSAFRAFLDRHPGKSLLTFTPIEEGARFGTPPRPYLVYVDRRPSLADAAELVRRIHTERRPAFVIPDGARVQVWAGTSSEDDARQVALALGLQGTPTVRELGAGERSYEVTPVDLLVSLAEVKVEGLDPQRLPRAKALLHPVAPLLSPASIYGVTLTSADPDGVVRGVPHLLAYVPRPGELHVVPSAALAAAMQLAGTRELRYADGRLHVGDVYSIPADASGYGLIRWDATLERSRDARGTMKRDVSAWRLVVNERERSRGLPPRFRNELEGRTVIVADTSAYSPTASLTAAGAAIPDAAITGQALTNLIRSDGVRRSTPRIDVLLVIGMAFLGAFLALTFAGAVRSRLGGFAYALLLLVAGGAYVFIARMLFVDDRLWIPIAGPLLAMTATVLATTTYAVTVERRIRDFVYSVLGRHISPEVVRQVARDLSLTRPEKRQVTIVFCDIEGFTRLSQELPPQRLAELLNEFLTEMTTVVRGHGGQVEYMGDTLMAFWGAPLRTDRHAHHGCDSMLQMREALEKRQAAWTQRFGHPIEFRAGMNSGEVVAGDMGSELKSNYTVLGDPVILASRLERANREFGTWILVGEETVRSARDAFTFREIDRLRVRPQGAPMEVFELVARNDALTAENARMLGLHQRALGAYRDRRFDAALELFRQLHKDFGDHVAEVYVHRCERLLSHPPPAEWDGVFEQRAA